MSLLLLATTLGCGSDAEAPLHPSNSEPAASAGDESPPEPAAVAEPSGEPSNSPEPSPVRASGPATLKVVASLAGQPIQANVLVLDEQGEHKAEATTGVPITVPAGSYKLEIAITGAAVMVDKPTQVRERVCRPLKAKLTEAQQKWQCDEYPFASPTRARTSAQNPTAGSGFSVRYVNAKHNASAGGSLVQWYKSNNVIPRDRFYVEIEPTASSHEQDIMELGMRVVE